MDKFGGVNLLCTFRRLKFSFHMVPYVKENEKKILKKNIGKKWLGDMVDR